MWPWACPLTIIYKCVLTLVFKLTSTWPWSIPHTDGHLSIKLRAYFNFSVNETLIRESTRDALHVIDDAESSEHEVHKLSQCPCGFSTNKVQYSCGITIFMFRCPMLAPTLGSRQHESCSSNHVTHMTNICWTEFAFKNAQHWSNIRMSNIIASNLSCVSLCDICRTASRCLRLSSCLSSVFGPFVLWRGVRGLFGKQKHRSCFTHWLDVARVTIAIRLFLSNPWSVRLKCWLFNGQCCQSLCETVHALVFDQMPRILHPTNHSSSQVHRKWISFWLNIHHVESNVHDLHLTFRAFCAGRSDHTFSFMTSPRRLCIPTQGCFGEDKRRISNNQIYSAVTTDHEVQDIALGALNYLL